MPARMDTHLRRSLTACSSSYPRTLCILRMTGTSVWNFQFPMITTLCTAHLKVGSSARERGIQDDVGGIDDDESQNNLLFSYCTETS
eukprot:2653880-Rhodomonas_salina.3